MSMETFVQGGLATEKTLAEVATSAASTATAIYNEDAASADGTPGVAILFERKDDETAVAGSPGDYSRPTVNSAGRVRVDATLAEVATAADGAAAPAVVKVAGGVDGVGNTQALATDTDGQLQVDVLSSALPTGASTAANQTTANGLLTTIDADTSALAGTVAGTEVQVDIVAELPAGTNNIGDVDVATLPGTTETSINATATSLAILDDWDESDRAKVNLIVGQAGVAGGSGAVDATTQRVTLATDVALPTGDNNIGNVDLASAIPAGNNNIGDVDVATLPGTVETSINATATSLAILDDWDESDRAKVNPIAGQAGVQGGSGGVSALTQRVVLATDVALPAGTNNIGDVDILTTVRPAGSSVVTTTRNAYASVNVTTGAWVELVASLSATVKSLSIFDSSGQTLELGTGAGGAEARLMLIFPGGNGAEPVAIASGTRVSIRAVSATASVGELDINFYG